MASTNKTSNLQLSQFIATDTPTWLVDYNGDMEKIDAGVGRVEELAETASTQAVGVASGLQTTNQTVTTLSGQIANVQNQANTTTASVNGINQRLGNTDISGIGDGTITGAISVLNSNLPSINDYSTDEKLIGTFLGKQLYRKSFKVASASQVNTDVKLTSDKPFNNCVVVNIYGALYSASANFCIPCNHTNGNTYISTLVSAGDLYNRVNDPSYVSQDLYVTVEYTKN